jgi:hypothetical protein
MLDNNKICPHNSDIHTYTHTLTHTHTHSHTHTHTHTHIIAKRERDIVDNLLLSSFFPLHLSLFVHTHTLMFAFLYFIVTSMTRPFIFNVFYRLSCFVNVTLRDDQYYLNIGCLKKFHTFQSVNTSIKELFRLKKDFLDLILFTNLICKPFL